MSPLDAYSGWHWLRWANPTMRVIQNDTQMDMSVEANFIQCINSYGRCLNDGKHRVILSMTVYNTGAIVPHWHKEL